MRETCAIAVSSLVIRKEMCCLIPLLSLLVLTLITVF